MVSHAPQLCVPEVFQPSQASIRRIAPSVSQSLPVIVWKGLMLLKKSLGWRKRMRAGAEGRG